VTVVSRYLLLVTILLTDCATLAVHITAMYLRNHLLLEPGQVLTNLIQALVLKGLRRSPHLLLVWLSAHSALQWSLLSGHIFLGYHILGLAQVIDGHRLSASLDLRDVAQVLAVSALTHHPVICSLLLIRLLVLMDPCITSRVIAASDHTVERHVVSEIVKLG